MKIDRHTTWLILRDGERVLFCEKKVGFGKGKLVAAGGKVNKNESFREAAIRECEEELGVKALDPKARGELIFDNINYSEKRETHMMHVFVATKWEGEIRETEELIPAWWDIREIPYDRLWEDDQHWLPYILADEAIQGYFHFNEEMRIDDFWVEPISKILINRFDDESVGAGEDGTKHNKIDTILENENIFLDEGDNPLNWSVRVAARAVLIDENMRVALMDVTRGGYFKIPGGGVDENEFLHEALRREVREEAGYEIEILEQLGYTIEQRAQKQIVYVSQCYLVRATKFVGASLMPDEVEDGFELKWYGNIDEAIAAAEKVDPSDKFYHAKFFIPRDLAILYAARPVIRGHYGG